MDLETSIARYDISREYTEGYQKYLLSERGEQVQTEFLRKLQQHVTIGDTEKLKDYLRNEKENTLKQFESTFCGNVYKKCFDINTNNFDEDSFFKKMYVINDGMFPEQEIICYYEYKRLNDLIDSLLIKTINYEKQNTQANIKANNFVVIGGDVNVHDNTPKPETEDEIRDKIFDNLKNIIFNPRIFDTYEKLLELCLCICSYINLESNNDKMCAAATNQINPEYQNEWYYIFLAISESDVVIRRNFTDVNFFAQMIDWFPWLFISNETDRFEDLKRKFAKSISAERAKWKYGKSKEVTKINDMWARQKSLKIDYAKLTRLHSVASQLKTKLSELKTKLQKENIH